MHQRRTDLALGTNTTIPATGMRRRRGPAGIALVQVIVAMGMIVVCGAGALRALIEMNRNAAAMRALAQARAIVQRNIDSALGVPFDATNSPAVLAITASSGSVYDDDGGGDNLVNISVGRSGTGAVARGTLTRIVTAQSNPDNADIRRVTFRLNYTFGPRPYSFEMTTIRAKD